jgi:hypothetical protein
MPLDICAGYGAKSHDKNHAPVTREKENSILVSFLMSVEKAGVEEQFLYQEKTHFKLSLKGGALEGGNLLLVIITCTEKILPVFVVLAARYVISHFKTPHPNSQKQAPQRTALRLAHGSSAARTPPGNITRPWTPFSTQL